MKKFLSILMVMAMLVAALSMLAVPTAADEASATDTYLGYSDSTAEYNITTVADFKNFYKDLLTWTANGKTTTWAGKTVNLLADIKLNDTSAANWYETASPLIAGLTGAWAGRGVFSGTFNGNGHTISGVVMEISARSEGTLGLFPYLLNGTIKDFTLDGFYIKNRMRSSGAGGWAGAGDYAYATGAVVGEASNSSLISNITVKNGTVTCVDYGDGANSSAVYLGAVVGVWRMEKNANGVCDAQTFGIKGCTVENTVNVVAGNGWSDPRTAGLIALISPSAGLASSLTIDVTASCIKPAGELEPIGAIVAYDAKSANITIKNDAHNVLLIATHDAVNTGDDPTPEQKEECAKLRLPAINTELKRAKFYGGDYEEPLKYGITWSINGKTETDQVMFGLVPSCTYDYQRLVTDTKVLKFKGWSVDGQNVLDALPAVTANTTYTALYEEFDRVDITWEYGDGKTYTVTYAKGDTVDTTAFNLDTRKNETENCIYTFKNWDKTVTTADETTTIKAVYEERNKYTITWVIDGVEVKKQIVVNNGRVKFDGKAEKAEDDKYTYTFKGWSTDGTTVLESIPSATANATYIAVFEAVAKNPDAAETTAASTDDNGGCGSMISVGMVTVLAVGAAGAVIARKKKD